MAARNTTRLNETFDLLANPHRRYVLYYLTTESEEVDIETLAAAIANWGGGQTAMGRSASSDTIKTVLRHTHLPKLADAGFISFDVDASSIELSETNGHDRFIAVAARRDGYTKTAAGD